ncbi:unnamed protein product [Prorocentrum cordatum]|uniref:Apple domain-containing protein n=1 Tax=Prorocentrum cordatum TaxID=2364126 RepID=A0ABN9V4I4_9DINO|nr:unnamed protein product [Polarella glacialis]
MPCPGAPGGGRAFAAPPRPRRGRRLLAWPPSWQLLPGPSAAPLAGRPGPRAPPRGPPAAPPRPGPPAEGAGPAAEVEGVAVSGYDYMGRGECATDEKKLFDQWSGGPVDLRDCAGMCTGVSECIGFEVKEAHKSCVLRFSDGTLPVDSPYPAVLKGRWDGHNGVAPITLAWDGTMEQRQAVFLDLRCYRKQGGPR